MFAHTLDEQKKEPMRQYIYNMIYLWDDLSDINVNEDKILLDELILMTKECKNCLTKKCPGGYNCKFGICLRENKICYNDLMYGKCYNMLMESNENGIIINRCISGIHLTEKKFIPYNQRMLSDLTNIETNFLIRHNISFNSKHNIISLILNENTLQIAKEIISNKLSKSDIIDNLKFYNNLFIEKKFEDTDLKNLDNIFDDIMYEENKDISKLKNEQEKIKNEDSDYDDNNNIKKNDMKYDKEEILDNIIIYEDLNNKNINFSNSIYEIKKNDILLNYKLELEKFNSHTEIKNEKTDLKILELENYDKNNNIQNITNEEIM
jgi:hypothetical protein